MIICQHILGTLTQIRMSHSETAKARRKELKAIRKQLSQQI